MTDQGLEQSRFCHVLQIDVDGSFYVQPFFRPHLRIVIHRLPVTPCHLLKQGFAVSSCQKFVETIFKTYPTSRFGNISYGSSPQMRKVQESPVHIFENHPSAKTTFSENRPLGHFLFVLIVDELPVQDQIPSDRKSTRLNSSHVK